MRLSVFCLFLTCLAPITPLQAAGEGNTLQQIAKTAKIRVGYREAEPPFSYQLPNGEVTGFSTDLCRAISEDIRRKLKLDRIELEYVKATPATRFSPLSFEPMKAQAWSPFQLQSTSSPPAMPALTLISQS